MKNAQQTYLIRKTMLQAIDERLADLEKELMSRENIINHDGTRPETPSDVDDLELMLALTEKISANPEFKALNEAFGKAVKELLKAEDALIDRSLEFMARHGFASEAQTLNNARNNYTQRQKIVEYAMKTKF